MEEAAFVGGEVGVGGGRWSGSLYYLKDSDFAGVADVLVVDDGVHHALIVGGCAATDGYAADGCSRTVPIGRCRLTGRGTVVT